MKNHSVIGEGSYGCIIKPELKCDSDKEIITNNIIDKNIKGGIIIKVGDEVLDGSVSAQLKRLEKELVK